MKKINLTIDLSIYFLFYLCFSQFIEPVIRSIVPHLGVTLPYYSEFFWDLNDFFIAHLYFPLIVFLIIISCCELYYNIFDFLLAKILVKSIWAVFLITLMVAIPLPITLSLAN